MIIEDVPESIGICGATASTVYPHDSRRCLGPHGSRP
jgi:hypothetical protein